MRRTVLLLASMTMALMLASVVALIVSKEQARAAFPGKNGKIVFARDPDGPRGPRDSEIYTIWFDGNNLTRLTNNSTPDLDPAWSADGKKIVFSHRKDIYTMKANGSAKTLVTDERKIPGKATGWDTDPAFSPNGRWIVFQRDSTATVDYGNIFKIRIDGTNPTWLAYGVYHPDSLSWSPDGTRIAYSDKEDSYRPEEYVLTMRPDGSGRRYRTEGSAPDWSPDGSRIVFLSGNRFDGIYEMDASGSGEKPLFNYRGYEDDPAFSPGGGKIVFASDKDGDYDLYMTNADGSDTPQRLTNQSGAERTPDWQPLQ